MWEQPQPIIVDVYGKAVLPTEYLDIALKHFQDDPKKIIKYLYLFSSLAHV